MGPPRLLADRFYLRMFGKGYIRNADEIERSSVTDRDSRRCFGRRERLPCLYVCVQQEPSYSD